MTESNALPTRQLQAPAGVREKDHGLARPNPLRAGRLALLPSSESHAAREPFYAFRAAGVQPLVRWHPHVRVWQKRCQIDIRRHRRLSKASLELRVLQQYCFQYLSREMIHCASGIT